MISNSIIGNSNKSVDISDVSDEQFWDFIAELRLENDFEEIANTLENPHFPAHLITKIFLFEPDDDLPLMQKVLRSKDENPLALIERFAKSCNKILLGQILFSNFTRYSSLFENLMQIAERAIITKEIKEQLELLIGDFIEQVDTEAIDKFLIENNYKKYSNLTTIMEYGTNKNFIKLIKKASPTALKIALLKSIHEDLKLFTYSTSFLSPAAFEILIKERDSETVNYILDKLCVNQVENKETLQPQLLPISVTEQTEVKSPAELLQELQINNLSNAAVINLVSNNNLEQQLENIKSHHKKVSWLEISAKPISSWTNLECRQWAACIKDSPSRAVDSTFQTEIIAVCMQAVKIHLGYLPRDTQLLSLLLLTNTNGKGRLAQVATGEGKSLTIALLAIIQVLQGKKVDIVTSSPILAARDCQEKKPLFDLFNISVADNWDKKDDNNPTVGGKECYLADIVYGDETSFEWDILRDKYLEQGTRCGRPQQVVIADEVDSMLLDGFSRGGRLAMPTSSMESLHLMLASVWQELIRIEWNFKKEKIDFDTNRPLVTSILKEYLLKLIADKDSDVYVPNHLKEFALYQVNNWIESAINVLRHYCVDINYVIDHVNKIISPVDYTNTGVVQTDSVWDNGIHQFLQIKEGFAIQSESLFSCFISNAEFFNGYGNQIYGLTGTLGSEATRNLLSAIYPVDLVLIPSFKISQFKKIPGLLTDSTDSWLKSIIHSTKTEIDKGRAVLIICESIKVVKQLASELTKTIDAETTPITCYTGRDNNENLAINKIVQPRQVIIATNIAGRGTDIKTCAEVEKNGGLHVCVTFLPENKRVEDQAFGRTARQGNSGTGQLIIDKTKSSYPEADDMDEVEEFRHQNEMAKLNKILNFDIKKIALEDSLLSEFFLLIKELRKINDNEDAISEIKDSFGFWLKKCSDKMESTNTINSQEILDDYNNFKQKTLDGYNQFNYANPCHLILEANKTASNELAIQNLNKAMLLDPILSVQAPYNLAAKLLNENKGNAREEALNNLAIAKLTLEEHIIPQLQATPVVAHSISNEAAGQSELTKQSQTKVSIYRRQIEHIDGAMATIRKATPNSTLVVNASGKLFDAYEKLNASPQQMAEIYQSGLNDFFDIEEIPEEEDDDDDFFGVFAVIGFGIMQITLGVAVCMLPGVGPLIGTALISEGIGDIIYAVSSAMQGTFNLDAYAAGKTTSLAISIVLAGIDILKVRLAANSAKIVAEETAKQTFTKPQLMAAFKKQAIKSAKVAVLKEVGGLVINNLTRSKIKDYKPEIKNHVQKIFLKYFEQEEVRVGIDKLLTADKSYYISVLIKTAKGIIYSNHRSKTLAENIFKTAIAKQHLILGIAIKLVDIGGALEDISSLTENFCEDFTFTIKRLSHSLPLSNEDLTSLRNQLYDHFIDIITKNIMSLLHGQVIRPVTDSLVSYQVDKLINRLESKNQIIHQANNLATDLIQNKNPVPDYTMGVLSPALLAAKTQASQHISMPAVRATERGVNIKQPQLNFNIQRASDFCFDYYNHLSNSANNNSYNSINFIVKQASAHSDARRVYLAIVPKAILQDEKHEFFDPDAAYTMMKSGAYGLHKNHLLGKKWLGKSFSVFEHGLNYGANYIEERAHPSSANLLESSLFDTAADFFLDRSIGAGLVIGFELMGFAGKNLTETVSTVIPEVQEKLLLDSGPTALEHYKNLWTLKTWGECIQKPKAGWDYLKHGAAKHWHNWNMSERSLGLLQCAGGVLQVGASVGIGLITIETGIGPVLAAVSATTGLDNAVAGCNTAATGVSDATLLNKGMQDLGFTPSQASIIELGVNVSPLVLPGLGNTAASQFQQIGLFSKQVAQDAVVTTQKVKTYVALRNGNVFTSHPTLYHVKTDLKATQAMFYEGIPKSLNPNNRFGAAFYGSHNGFTAVSELAYHGLRARHAIRYRLNESRVKLLDFTKKSIAKEWGYLGGNNYSSSQAIALKARKAGFNVIRVPSERGLGIAAGANLVILKDFNKLLTREKIIPVPYKQPARFSNPWK